MTFSELIRRPSAFVPLALSLAALGLILGFVATFGIIRREGEGAAARVFQLLMLVQVLAITFFAIRWVPAAPRQALPILLLQLLAAAVPIVLIVVLES